MSTSESSSAREWPVDDPASVTAIGEFLAGSPTAVATFGWMSGVVAGLGPATVRLTHTQVAFRRRVGFAWLCMPDQWLPHPDAELVVSLGASERLDSPRFTKVVQPYPGRWMHHLEVPTLAELDDQVAGWLAQCYDAAG